MGLVNIENRIAKKSCSILDRVVKGERCGSFSAEDDLELKKMSIISSFWKTWSAEQIEKLETYLFNNR